MLKKNEIIVKSIVSIANLKVSMFDPAINSFSYDIIGSYAHIIVNKVYKIKGGIINDYTTKLILDLNKINNENMSNYVNYILCN